MYRLYYSLPVSLQHIACSIEGYRLRKRRFNKQFRDILQDVEERYKLYQINMAVFRDKRLKEFVRHAAETVPYYKQYFQEQSIDPKNICSIEDLKILPVIEKSDIQNNEENFISNAITNKHYHISRTSGTTGAGLKVFISDAASREAWAVITRFRKWHGLHYETWSAHFGGREVIHSSQNKPPFWRYNIPGRQILFSGYHLSEKTIPFYVEELIKRKIRWIHGYPSLISLIAQYAIDNNINMEDSVRWVTVGSENLLPMQIKNIKEAFGVSPIQQYGLTELVAHFSQCETGNLHVDEDFAAVEFLPTSDEGVYKIIGTNFNNMAMPLLRYDTKDTAILHDYCSCGRPGRVVRKIDGREEDYITLNDGTRHGRTASIFKYMSNIKEAQIYQKKPGYLTVRIVPSDKYTMEDERYLEKKLNERFNGKLQYDFTYMKNLERTDNGKLRFVISEVVNGKIHKAE